jgi:hypothetical protein
MFKDSHDLWPEQSHLKRRLKMQEMEEKLGIKVGKGKVGPEILKTFEEIVAPRVLPSVVRGIMKGVFKLDEEARNTVL